MNVAAPAPRAYTRTAIALHWLAAVLLVGQWVLGLWMVELPKDPPGLRAGWFNVHKSWGIVVLVVMIARLLWRVTHTPPPLPSTMPAWQRAAASLTHAALVLVALALPICGFIGSSASKYPIKFFGTPLPRWLDENPALKDVMSQAHTVLAWALLALVLLHVAAALKHAWVDRDDVLASMTRLRTPSPGTRSAR